MTETTVEKVAELGPYVSIGVTLTDDAGAHPNTSQQHYLIDTRLGVPVLPTEIVDPDAMYFICAFCCGTLDRDARTNGWDLFDNLRDNVERVLARMTSWSFREKALVIAFDPYTVAAYVYGPKEVVIPYAESNLANALTVEFRQIVLP